MERSGDARLHLAEYFSTFFLPDAESKECLGSPLQKKNNDANAHMIPPHHAAPCSLSRVKFVYPISNQLQFTQQYMSHCVPPLSAKLKTVTL